VEPKTPGLPCAEASEGMPQADSRAAKETLPEPETGRDHDGRSAEI
jgi:hypothetical protein